VKTGSPQAPAHDDAERRARRVRAAVVLGSLLGAVVVLFACGTDTSLSGPGEECFAATDCQAGLVCVPQRGGSRLCSSDLTQVDGRPPPEAGAADSEAGDAPEGSVIDGPAQDTSMPDTSMPDTSMPVDAAEAG
jgi:hypothetical protein